MGDGQRGPAGAGFRPHQGRASLIAAVAAIVAAFAFQEWKGLRLQKHF
jgi:hypothetical protein